MSHRFPFGTLHALLFLCAGLSLLASGAVPAAGARPAHLEVRILGLSGWQGQLDPVSVPEVGRVGGAAVLSAYWQRERGEQPRTLALGTGSSFGASPPLSRRFDEVPAILALSLMGLDADVLGTHSFDHGLPVLQQLIRLARFPMLSANLRNVESNLDGVAPLRIFNLGGVRVAVVGLTNEDARTLVFPGTMGTLEVAAMAGAARQARERARRAGATVFVASAAVGANWNAAAQRAEGPLIELARRLSGFDALLGEGPDEAFIQRVNGVEVVQNRLHGVTYSRTRLQIDRRKHRAVQSATELVTPLESGVTPDAGIEAVLTPYRDQLSLLLEKPAGTTAGLFPDVETRGWTRETEIGNLVADAMRAVGGTQLGVMNSGSIRDGLPSRFQPADTRLRRPVEGYAPGLPYDVVGGDLYTLLPFDNRAVTRQVTGALLHAMLENSVSMLPAEAGRFLQVSGFRFTYDSRRPAGQRIVSVTRDGGAPLPADGTSYTLTLPDYINVGGDGYSMLAGEGTVLADLTEVLGQHLFNASPVTPVRDGRIVDLAPTGSS